METTGIIDECLLEYYKMWLYLDPTIRENDRRDETSNLTRATRHNIPEDVRYCYRRENIQEDSLIRTHIPEQLFCTNLYDYTVQKTATYQKLPGSS
jgi:hypothetical protein